MARLFKNPFRPGAGHMPPVLAGREGEIKEFGKLLEQDLILENLVLTGLRGVGKTVLLETFKPLAIDAGWLWIGTDLSESASVSEENLATRLIADLSVVTSQLVVREEVMEGLWLRNEPRVLRTTLNFDVLVGIYQSVPGLAADKLKVVLETAWRHLGTHGKRGIIFAYDEAQNLADHSAERQYPLSLLLDVFQSIQKKEIPFMLALTGLPTLFPKLVEARTFAERMFHVVHIDRLSREASRKAITEPVRKDNCPVSFTDAAVEQVVAESGGYAYFIQFICRETYDIVIQRADAGEDAPAIDLTGVVRKLDADFFDGRWSKATDRQRDLLELIATLETADREFTGAEIVSASKANPATTFSSSHVNQMLTTLCDRGLIFKNRHGRYSFAVPLLGQYIRRRGRLPGT